MNSIGIVILLMAISYATYCVSELVKNPTEIFVVSNGTLSIEEQSSGLIIRDEEVLKSENYKNGLEPIKIEGERVAKGDSVFSYHNKNEDTLKAKIEDLDSKINVLMKSETDLFPNDVKLIEKQVETKLDSVYNENELQKINENKKDINSSINKKAKIAGELSVSGSQLKKLIEERTGYANELNSGLEVVQATSSGIISYRVDELETVLKPGDFTYLSLDLLEGLNIKTGQIIATSNEKGKIINNFICYIVTVLNSREAKEAEIGDKLILRLSSSDEISAKVSYIADVEGDKRIVVFETVEKVEQLISYRKISIDVVWKKNTGLKVPNSAIRYDGELTYVTRNRAGYTDEILVKVATKNETYSIIENYKVETLKEMGFSTEQINSRKTIALYDEIVVTR